MKMVTIEISGMSGICIVHTACACAHCNYLCMHMKEKLFYSSIQLGLSSTNIMYPLKKMYKTSTKEKKFNICE